MNVLAAFQFLNSIIIFSNSQRRLICIKSKITGKAIFISDFAQPCIQEIVKPKETVILTGRVTNADSNSPPPKKSGVNIALFHDLRLSAWPS